MSGVHDPTFCHWITFFSITQAQGHPFAQYSLCQSSYIYSISSPLEYFTRYSISNKSCQTALWYFPFLNYKLLPPFSVMWKSLILAGEFSCLVLQENHLLSSEHLLQPANISAFLCRVSMWSHMLCLDFWPQHFLTHRGTDHRLNVISFHSRGKENGHCKSSTLESGQNIFPLLIAAHGLNYLQIAIIISQACTLN